MCYNKAESKAIFISPVGLIRPGKWGSHGSFAPIAAEWFFERLLRGLAFSHKRTLVSHHSEQKKNGIKTDFRPSTDQRRSTEVQDMGCGISSPSPKFVRCKD